MPTYSQSRQRSTNGSGSSSSEGTSTDVGSNQDAIEDLNAEQREQVVVYLTQNSVTHENDEIPETLAALKRADQHGLGRKSLLPISDPFANGHKTDQYAIGDQASTMTWWHDDKALESGQVRVGDKVLTLGASKTADAADPAFVQKVQGDWLPLLTHVGLDEQRAQSVVSALLTDQDGAAKLTASGGRAANELVQLIAVLNRAENGEFDISSLVLSGHHYSGTDYLFGELPGHNYDTENFAGDMLSLKDIQGLSAVFPKAFSQVNSVMFSACNTHDIDMQDEAGQDMSTPDWVSEVFPNVDHLSFWEGIAPGSDLAAFWSGEFALDVAREDSGQAEAFGDALWRTTKKGENRRAEKNADGEFETFDAKKNSKSYTYNNYKGYRNSGGEAFTSRADLMKYLYKR